MLCHRCRGEGISVNGCFINRAVEYLAIETNRHCLRVPLTRDRAVLLDITDAKGINRIRGELHTVHRGKGISAGGSRDGRLVWYKNHVGGLRTAGNGGRGEYAIRVKIGVCSVVSEHQMKPLGCRFLKWNIEFQGWNSSIISAIEINHPGGICLQLYRAGVRSAAIPAHRSSRTENARHRNGVPVNVAP